MKFSNVSFFKSNKIFDIVLSLIIFEKYKNFLMLEIQLDLRNCFDPLILGLVCVLVLI